MQTIPNPIRILLYIAILSFAACGQAQQPEVAGFPSASPEALGFSAQELEAIKQHIRGYVDRQVLSGVVVVLARDGKIVLADAYGMRDLEQRRPMQFGTIFRIASMTKPLTSTALMMLIEQGRLELDDPVSRYLPEFATTPVFAGEGKTVPLERPLTVRDMLTHTSGYTSGQFGNTPLHKLYRASDLDQATDLADFVTRLARLPLLHQPGASWSYGYSTDVAARLVEVISGMPIEQYVTQHILQPLGMDDTSYRLAEDQADRLAAVYTTRGGEGLQRLDVAANFRFPRGVGGITSTAGDYLRFAQMLLNGGELNGKRLLQPETVDLMTRNHLPDDLIPIGVMGMEMANNGFGLGFSVVVDSQDVPPLPNGFWWNRGAPPVGSYWWVGSFQTYFWIDPANRIIGILMTQSPEMMPYDYKQEFHTMVYGAFGGGR